MLFSPLSKIISLEMQKSIRDERMTSGISLLIVPRPILMGATSAVQPMIARILNMLLPTTLPTANPALPFKADNILIINSGADVPNATIVSPTTKSEMLNFFATAEAPSVSIFAPTKIKTRPKINKMITITSIKN